MSVESGATGPRSGISACVFSDESADRAIAMTRLPVLLAIAAAAE
jgi:hypothetical protein